MSSKNMPADLEYADGRNGLFAWLVCCFAGLFFFYEFFQLNIFDVINQPLRDEFKIGAAELSWMSSGFLWADILFLLPAGIILDRFSTRWVILISLTICILGTFGFALTNSFFLACFYHFLTGIGNAFCFLACVVLVTQWFDSQRQALVIGLLVTMAFIGGMMAHTPFSYLTEHYGWRNSLLIDGALGILCLIGIFLVVQDRPKNVAYTSVPMTWSSLKQSFLTVLANTQNWFAGLYTCFLNLPIMVLCALWGASYLKVVHHLSDLAASNVVSMIYIGSIIGCPLVGWLSDRQGRRKPLMIIGAVATLLIVMPLFLNDMLSQASLSIIFFMLGLVTSTQVISYPLIAESNYERNTGSATAVASVIIMGGAAVAQILFGWLMQYHAASSNLALTTKVYSMADFQYAMWMFPLAALLALIAIILTRETNCTRLTHGDQ